MYEIKTVKEVEEELGVSIEKGLSILEVENRRKKQGKNALKEDKKKSILALFFQQFQDPMIFILFIASIFSFLLKEHVDAVIILFVIFLNAIVGTIQEAKAEKSLEALKKLSAPTCIVKREGSLQEIKAEDLVVGDIVILEEGRTIPADLRLCETVNLKVDESSLTGESLPVMKQKEALSHEVALGDKMNMGFMSTSVVYGRGSGIVISTGMHTEIGKIASMIHESKEEMTPLQKRLADLGKVLGILTVVLCLSLFIVSLIQKRNPLEMLITSISLAVAAIPEGLPAAVTIVLALGVQKMVKANTIVRRLPSVETLGAVSVVCSDKTGTLTQNKMTVQKIYWNGLIQDIQKVKKEDMFTLIEGFLLCNNASLKERMGDPTELALLEMGELYSCYKEENEKLYPRIDEIPFDSKRKMMTTVHQYAGKKRMYTKGALDVLLDRSSYIVKDGRVVPLRKEDKERILSCNHEMAQNALRVLAIAYKESGDKEENQLIFLGFVGMMDLPRPGVREAIERFKDAGIRSIMITGDHPDTALAVAKEIGLASQKEECLTGTQMDALNDDEWKKALTRTSVFARVTPEHKVRIVKGLKEQNQIVAMTGDGVNDAPSLKAADIGIAMGITGTDVAKASSDMVLVDDHFASIEKAVEEGRGIYANIKKVVLFLLSSNFGEVFTMFLAVLFRLPVPLIAIHILWVNLITDTLPALALGADKKDEDIMKEKPRKANESLFAKGGLRLTIFYGIFITLLTLFAFLAYPMSFVLQSPQYSFLSIKENWIALKEIFEIGVPSLGVSKEMVVMRSRTYAFTALGLSQLFHMLGMSNVKKSIVHILKNKNPLLFVAFIVGFLLQILVIEVPVFRSFFQTADLNYMEWMWLILCSALPLFVHECRVPRKKKKVKA